MNAVILDGTTAHADAALACHPETSPTPIWNRVLAHNVRHFRRSRGVSQEVLAAECGIFRSYLSRIENGSANPSLSVLMALASAFNITPAQLLTPLA